MCTCDTPPTVRLRARDLYAFYRQCARHWRKTAWASYTHAGERIAVSTDADPADLAAFDRAAAVASARLLRLQASYPQLVSAAAAGALYLRFGPLPRSGRSRNFATGRSEAGVSVYAAQLDPVTGQIEPVGSALAGALIAYTLAGKPVYAVTGAEIGTGSDGEPLLRHIRILAPLGRDLIPEEGK